MKGRKPTPTILKLIKGNPGKRPLNMDEPKPEIVSYTHPIEFLGEKYIDIMDDISIDFWHKNYRVLKRNGVMTEMDNMEFVLQNIDISEYVRLLRIAKENFGMYKDREGIVKSTPIRTQINFLRERLSASFSRFGMTPSDRSRIKIEKEIEKKVNPFAEYVNG